MKISSKKLKQILGSGWEIESIEEGPKLKEKPKPIPQVVVSKPESSAKTERFLINIADAIEEAKSRIVKKRIDEHLKKTEVPEKKKSTWRFEIHRDRNGLAQNITVLDENENRMRWDFNILRDRDGFMKSVKAIEI